MAEQSDQGWLGKVKDVIGDAGKTLQKGARVAVLGGTIAMGAPQWSSEDFEFRFPAADAADSKFRTNPEFQKNAQKLAYKVEEAILARMRVSKANGLAKTETADPDLFAIAMQHKTLKVGEVSKSLTYSRSEYGKMWTGLNLGNVDRVEVSFFKKNLDDRAWFRFRFMDDDDVVCEVDVPHKQPLREELPKDFDK